MRTTSYTYNLDGSIQTITYPSGRTITYLAGGAGVPLSAVDNGSGISYAANAKYTSAGALATLALGQNAAIKLTQLYNSRLQPAMIRAISANDTVLDLAYDFAWERANNGNVMGIANLRNADRSQAFAYDGLNRLLLARTEATTGTYSWGQVFGYDPWGNLLTMTPTQGTGLIPFSVTVNNKNQLSSPYGYDAAGNLTSDGSTWDAEGRLISAGGVTYTYDGDGKRVKKSNGTLYWYGLGSDPLMETDLNGNLQNEYIFFGGTRIARRDAAGNVNFYLSDHLGSSRVVTDASGAILDDCDFLPFGTERCYASGSNNHYKFTGQERDDPVATTANDHFFARYYANTLGRWLSPDPVAGDISNPQSLNRYAYVMNNPTNRADPSGAGDPPPGARERGRAYANYLRECLIHSCGLYGTSIIAGNQIWDALMGAPGTYLTFDNNGQLNGFGFQPQSSFQYHFHGSLYGSRDPYDETFDTWDEYAYWRTGIAALPRNQVYAVFAVVCGNRGCDPNAEYDVGYQSGNLLYSVWLKCDSGAGCTVNKSNLNGFWSDPFTILHQGNPSWYSGFFFDTPHLIGSDPVSAHIDPFGPMNPLHYLIQMPEMLFPSALAGSATCRLNGGCTIH